MKFKTGDYVRDPSDSTYRALIVEADKDSYYIQRLDIPMEPTLIPGEYTFYIEDALELDEEYMVTKILEKYEEV